jgi:hypothetical protein
LSDGEEEEVRRVAVAGSSRGIARVARSLSQGFAKDFFAKSVLQVGANQKKREEKEKAD